MSTVQSIYADGFPVDAELCDIGTTGPELAWLARSYLDSPRALVFAQPSPDWRLFVLTLPLASRLALMANPVFAQLTRAWGLNIRFVGIDRDGLVHDLKALLSDRTLGMLVEILLRRGEEPDAAGQQPPPGSAGREALDLLFEALASEMLTVLDARGEDWAAHLAREHRLEPDAPAPLFDAAGRYPDFLAALRSALRNQIIDLALYGRALRSIDLREAAVDTRLAGLVESVLDPVTVAKLRRTKAGLHLGAYNWLRIAPHRAMERSHLLSRLPAFATFFAEALLPIDAGSAADPRSFDLRRVAARHHSAASLHWSALLARAVDSSQDRATIETLSQRFGVGANVIRRIWREQPKALGQPPTWHLAQILQALDAAGDRGWPTDEAAWRQLIASAVPVEAL